MQTEIERTIHLRFQSMASAQHRLVVSHCAALAEKHEDPPAWVREVFANVDARLAAADIEPGVREEARAQVALIATQLLGKVTVQRDAA